MEIRWVGFESRQGQMTANESLVRRLVHLLPRCLAGMLVYCYAMRISISNLLAW
jgi:hypothetical protein